MKNELKSMSTKKLIRHLEDVKNALVESKAKDRREALKAAEKAAAEFGFSLNELNGTTTGKKRGPKPKAKPAKIGTPKYANPNDPGQTWTGKGRQPNWYRLAVESGKTPEELAIA